jgi:hypothetical protein
MMMSAGFRVALVGLAGALASCGRLVGDGATYVQTDSMGVVVVESHSPVWGVTPLVIDSQPLLQLGKEEAGPYQFDRVNFGRLLSNGEIVVAEGSVGEVRRFAAGGEHLGTHGRMGEGPGEFRGLAQIFAYPGDSIAAWDGRLRRMTIFPKTPDPPRVVPSFVEGNFHPFGLLDNGSFLMYNPGSGYRPDLGAGRQWTETDVVAMDAVDGSGQTIARLPQREDLVRPDGNVTMLRPLRYAIHAVAGDGFYWATPDRYEIRFFDSDGVLERVIRRPIQPRAIEPAMIAEDVEHQLERVRQFEGEAAVPGYRKLYEDQPRGDVIPLFVLAFIDGDSRLWVAASDWPAEERLSRWSVFSSDGIWQGDLDAPERLQIMDARGDLVLGVWRNELDVPFVQVHRISQP